MLTREKEINMNNQITIQKENILNAYNQASGEQKSLLENLFGKDMFQPQDIKERVKTFEDACNELGDKHPLVSQYYRAFAAFNCEVMTKELFAYLKLRIICAALNEGWKPTFDKEEHRYYPWFYICTKEEYEEFDEDEKKKCRVVCCSSNHLVADGGLIYVSVYNSFSYSHTHLGSRLAFKTRELAEYCGKQFIDIWADFLFM